MSSNKIVGSLRCRTQERLLHREHRRSSAPDRWTKIITPCHGCYENKLERLSYRNFNIHASKDTAYLSAHISMLYFSSSLVLRK
jgi:hypothetical protein